MTNSNQVINESSNSNYKTIVEMNLNVEIRSQSNGKSRAYLTNGKNERITENGNSIFVDFYDNKGQSVTPAKSREGSHLDTALKLLVEKGKTLNLTAKNTSTKKQKLKI